MNKKKSLVIANPHPFFCQLRNALRRLFILQIRINGEPLLPVSVASDHTAYFLFLIASIGNVLESALSIPLKVEFQRQLDFKNAWKLECYS